MGSTLTGMLATVEFLGLEFGKVRVGNRKSVSVLTEEIELSKGHPRSRVDSFELLQTAKSMLYCDSKGPM